MSAEYFFIALAAAIPLVLIVPGPTNALLFASGALGLLNRTGPFSSSRPCRELNLTPSHRGRRRSGAQPFRSGEGFLQGRSIVAVLAGP